MFRSLLDFNKNRGTCFGHGHFGKCSCTGEGLCTNKKCSCLCAKTHGKKGAYGACAEPYHQR